MTEDPRFTRFGEDILDEPTTLDRVLRTYTGADSPLTTRHLRAQKDAPVIFIGMGSSYNAALAASWWLQAAGIPSWTIAASDLHMRAIPAHSTLVAVTKSGRTPETREAIDRFRTAGGDQVIVVTNEPTSEIAAVGDVILPLLAGAEGPISAKSYTATVTVLLLLAGSLTDIPGLSGADLHQVPDAAHRIIEAVDGIEQELISTLRGDSTIQVLAAGPGMAGAREGAVIFKEAPGFPVEAINTADWLHGAYRSVKNGQYVGILLQESPIRGFDDGAAARIEDLGGTVLTVGGTARRGHHIPIADLADAALPMVQNLPLELAAFHTWKAARGVTAPVT